MTRLQIRTGGKIRVKKLGRHQTALIGPRGEVAAEVARMEAARYPVTADRPQRLAGTGDVVTVLTLIPRDQRVPVEPTLPWWHHPGWIVAVLLSAAALIVTAAWVILTLVSAVLAAATLIIGVLAVVGFLLVLPRIGGGNRYTQIMNVHK